MRVFNSLFRVQPGLFIMFFCLQVVRTPVSAQDKVACMPVIDGEFWRIVEAPDLDSLNGEDATR